MNHSRLVLFIAGMMILALSARVIAEEKLSDWTQFRGPAGQGISKDKGLPTTWSNKDNVVWRIDLPGPGTSSPIVIGSRIFLTSYSGYNEPGRAGKMDDLKLQLLCLNRDDGKTLWAKDVAPKLPEQDKIREGHGYASSTPAADSERVYAFFGKSGVFAFDYDGKQLWHAEVGSNLNNWGSANSPVLVDDLVIINASVESDSLVALDKKTGKEVWRANGIKESWNTPVLVTVEQSKKELVVAIAGKVLGFDPATGKQLWSCATDIGSYMVPGLVVHEDVVYCIGGRTNGGLAVRAGGRGDVTKTHRLWTIVKGSNVASPIYHDGHLYWMNDKAGIAYCVEGKTGKIVYEERVQRADQVYASPVLADGKLYYIGRNGRTFVVAAKPEYELLATNEFGERSMFNASPAVAGGRLYVRSDKSLFCLGQNAK